jgi:hypothetical protein
VTNPRASRRRLKFCRTGIRSPPPNATEVTLWATVHDQRGGAAWRALDVIVRE